MKLGERFLPLLDGFSFWIWVLQGRQKNFANVGTVMHSLMCLGNLMVNKHNSITVNTHHA